MAPAPLPAWTSTLVTVGLCFLVVGASVATKPAVVSMGAILGLLAISALVVRQFVMDDCTRRDP
jgi:hypothetical protein